MGDRDKTPDLKKIIDALESAGCKVIGIERKCYSIVDTFLCIEIKPCYKKED